MKYLHALFYAFVAYFLLEKALLNSVIEPYLDHLP